MSRKGDCWDTAVAESFFGTLKAELVFRERFTTRREAKAEVIGYIEMFYNSHRLHSFLGYLPPIEFERRWELKKLLKNCPFLLEHVTAEYPESGLSNFSLLMTLLTTSL